MKHLMIKRTLESMMRKKSEKKCALKLRARQKTKKKSSNNALTMNIKNNYLKTMPKCRVTFRLPKEAAPEAQNVTIVGDFNDWNTNGTLMKRLKNGTFAVTIDLERDREYQFRYLIDYARWENDWNADKYVSTSYGDSENSVVVV